MTSKKVENFIVEVIPELKGTLTLEKLHAILKKDGVLKLEHIRFLQESDLSPPLTKIQARMLLQAISNMEECCKSKSEEQPLNKVLKQVNVKKVAGRNFIEGDQINAKNYTTMNDHHGPLHVGTKADSPSINISGGSITGDQLHFGKGKNIKFQR